MENEKIKPGKDFIGVGVGAHIINDNNEILLLRRSKNCRNKVGYWTIPGGKVEFNESIADALKREIREEVDIDIDIIKLLCVTNDIITKENQHWVAPQFLCKIISGIPKNMEPEKHDEINWFSLNNLPEKITKTTSDGIESYLLNKDNKIELKELQELILKQAKEKGFGIKVDKVNVGEKIALIHSEISEAYEAYRHKNIEGKDGFSEELGDAVQRILHLAGIFNIDIEKEILKKLEMNKDRNWDWENMNEKHS
jgi:8-oxo-dGTP diphosphatase